MAATQSLGPPSHDIVSMRVTQAHGRWFRFGSTTLTVPPRIVSKNHLGHVFIGIHASCPGQCSPPRADIVVAPGGGPGSVLMTAS